MACFVVPGAEALIAAAASKMIGRCEEKGLIHNDSAITLSENIGSLAKLCGGGSALLAFEHLWHGEITPFFPFITAAADPEQTSVMLHEMATSGVAMSLLVTAVWIGMTAVKSAAARKTAKEGEMK